MSKRWQISPNVILFLLQIFFIILLILGIVGYYKTATEIQKYRVPFMEIKIDLSQTQKYEAVFNKSFTPTYGIALCVVPEEKSAINQNLLKYFEGNFSISNSKGKELYKSYFSLNNIYKQSAIYKELNCSYIPKNLVPNGKYKFILNFDKKSPRIPCKIIALPVYEFLPMVSSFFKIVITFSAIVLIATFIMAFRSKSDIAVSTPKVL